MCQSWFEENTTENFDFEEGFKNNYKSLDKGKFEFVWFFNGHYW